MKKAQPIESQLSRNETRASYRDLHSEESDSSDGDELSDRIGKNRWNSLLIVPHIKTNPILRYDDMNVELLKSPNYANIVLKANESKKLKKYQQEDKDITLTSPDLPTEAKVLGNISNQNSPVKDRISNYINKPTFVYETQFQDNSFNCQFQYQNNVKSKSMANDQTHVPPLNRTIDESISGHKVVNSQVFGENHAGNSLILDNDSSPKAKYLSQTSYCPETFNCTVDQDTMDTNKTSHIVENLPPASISEIDEILSNLSLTENAKRYNIGQKHTKGVFFQTEDMNFQCLPDPNSERFEFHYVSDPSGTKMSFTDESRDLCVETKEK